MQKLNKLKTLALTTRTSIFDMKQLKVFEDTLVDILEQAVKNQTIKSVEWLIKNDTIVYGTNKTQTKHINYTITIENKDELLYCNKYRLRDKLSSIIQRSCQLVKNILFVENSKNGKKNVNHPSIRQNFKLDQTYLV